MGLLDDAIREHLELKRRAGADAMDVARQEREVLGRGDRGEPLAVPATETEQPYRAPEVDEGVEVGPYHDEPGAPGFYNDEPDDEFDEPHRYAAPPAPPAPPPPPPVPPAPTTPQSPEPPVTPPPARVRPLPTPPVQVTPPPPAGPPTEEFRLPLAESGPKDVLEETPDFLEETPEHDRLWFEQAPPQEFDFDK